MADSDAIVKDIVNDLIEIKEIRTHLILLGEYHKESLIHSIRVSIMAMKLALEENFGLDFVNFVGICGLLHDIGKRLIPLAILDKKDGLSDEERNIIRMHPRFSFDLLEDFPIEDVKKVVVAHHEFDVHDSYPRNSLRIGNENIARVAMLISFCDVYDALHSERAYKKPFSEPLIKDILFSHVFPWNGDEELKAIMSLLL